MSSPASFKGHSFHPMIVPLPIGLWFFSIVSDLIFKFDYGRAVRMTSLFTLSLAALSER
jgi:uncharacterized membrane protein